MVLKQDKIQKSNINYIIIINTVYNDIHQDLYHHQLRSLENDSSELSFIMNYNNSIFNEYMNNYNNNIINTNFYTNNKTVIYEEHL